MPVKLLVVRHTMVVRPEGRCFGRSELPLAPTYSTEYVGIRNILGRILADRGPCRILTSPLPRCNQLALELSTDPALAFAFHGQQPQQDERLLEFSYGSWEGRRWEDIDADRLEYWMDNWTVARAGDAVGDGDLNKNDLNQNGDGESLQDMLSRVADLCSELSQGAGAAYSAQKDVTFVLITHAGVVRCLYQLLGGLPPASAFSQDIGYGSVSEFVLPHNPAIHNHMKEQ